MEREACVCDHGFERSDLCAEIIIIIIITPFTSQRCYLPFICCSIYPSVNSRKDHTF